MGSGVLMAALASALIFTAQAADSPTQRLNLRLHTGDGQSLEAGTVLLTPEGDGYRFQVEWDETRFANHFLSMRPFRCLEDVERMLCHLPYPYRNDRRLLGDDLTDLEYDLLFIRKTADEYGIDPWNGVYYRLSWDGEGIRGELMEVDMNLLASPPPDGVLRPITGEDLHTPDPDNHWLPTVSIR